MKSARRQTRPFRLASLLTAGLLLMTACDNGAQTVGSRAPSGTQTRISGHVFDDEGPVTRAKIEVKDAKGALVAQTELKDAPAYSLTVPAGVSFPLVISAYPEATPGTALKAVVANEQTREQDVSPVTTLVVESALSFGGLTEANLAKAAGAALAQRTKSGGAGTSEGFRGDPTKQYGGWH
jgi:hypothetical protein